MRSRLAREDNQTGPKCSGHCSSLLLSHPDTSKLGRCNTEFGMSKLGRCCGRTAARRHHLYLVVDNWERGYDVHRVGEDDFDPDPNAAPGRPSARSLALRPSTRTLGHSPPTAARSSRCCHPSAAPASPCWTWRR
jgi:hypothetical protein